MFFWGKNYEKGFWCTSGYKVACVNTPEHIIQEIELKFDDQILFHLVKDFTILQNHNVQMIISTFILRSME